MNNKQYIYIAIIGLSAVIFAVLGWGWASGALIGFAIGFVVAVERVYKVATGETLKGSKEDSVYNKIL